MEIARNGRGKSSKRAAVCEAEGEGSRRGGRVSCPSCADIWRLVFPSLQVAQAANQGNNFSNALAGFSGLVSKLRSCLNAQQAGGRAGGREAGHKESPGRPLRVESAQGRLQPTLL